MSLRPSPQRWGVILSPRVERHRARAEAVEVAQEDPVIRERILKGVDSALARVTVTISGQSRRIAEESLGQAQRDMDTFVLAAEQLKAISTVMNDLGMDVAPLREEFESATPHIRTARDVFSHYEDYLLGIGQRQERRGEPVSMLYQRGDAAGTAVHMTNPDVVVDIGAAITAASSYASGLTGLAADNRMQGYPWGYDPSHSVVDGE